jgi:hypothetical protein
MIAIGFLLALGGCNSDGLIRRSEAEDIAEDFADAAASRQGARIDELEARAESLEQELAASRAAVDAVANVVDGNAEIANRNALAAATERGECGTELVRHSSGLIENRRIPCTAENYFKRK